MANAHASATVQWIVYSQFHGVCTESVLPQLRDVSRCPSRVSVPHWDFVLTMMLPRHHVLVKAMHMLSDSLLLCIVNIP